jgi:L-serine/L-threonine ammonia-lyase
MVGSDIGPRNLTGGAGLRPGVHVVTPLFASSPLSALLGAPVWLKLDALQPSGSFKLRGVGLACRRARERGATALVSSSGGNAGLAAAVAGRALGMRVTVVVPATTDVRMQGLLRGEQADVVVHGAVWDEAHAHATALAASSGAFLVHPFEGRDLWEGHATLIHEVAEQGPRPGVVVCAVGGGGLLCGVLQGLHDVGWASVPVVAAETEGAASYAAALAAGGPVTLPAITSLATSLGARRVADEAFAWSTRHEVRSVVVSDAAAVDACGRFLDDHRVLVEPACGAALAPVYGRAPVLLGAGPVLVVVCGGAGVTRERLAGWASSHR